MAHGAAAGHRVKGTARQGRWRLAGVGGVPPTVSVSLFVAFGWFGALAGSQWLGGRHGWVVLPVALVAAWAVTALACLPLRRLFPEPVAPPSRLDFVGRACVIRTGRVGPDFGQAEVRADDGSSAVVQVRQSAEEAGGPGALLRAGATALIYAYDEDGEFFHVMPHTLAPGAFPPGS